MPSSTAFAKYLEQLAVVLRRKSWQCATAESCTGGLLGATLTSVPGASEWYAGGVIAYDNSVKVRLLGVAETAIAQYGAVSAPVVEGMALGVCRCTGTLAGVSISGVAGPGGGTALKPVGLVWMGFAIDGVVTTEEWHFAGNRDSIREHAVRAALAGLCTRLG